MTNTKHPEEACDAEVQKHPLASPGAVRELTQSGQADAVVALLATLAPDEQKEILASEGAIWALVHHGQAVAVRP
jgi:hypothetical protein